jgi:esterase/lipase
MKDTFTEYGFERETIQQSSGELIVFYTKGNERAKSPKPLFLCISGSGPCSIMMKVNDSVGSSIIFDVNKLIEEYLLVIVSKPYIPFYTDTDFEVPEKYYETDSLDHQTKNNSDVIDFLIENAMIDPAKIVVCGVSHGSDVAAQVALLNRNVTHLACIAGNGLPQTYNFINEVRKEFRTGKISESEAEKQIQYLYSQFKEIYANPESIQTWWGHTYKYWYSFFIKSTVDTLLKLSIPIFFAKGTEDEAGCIEGTDIIPIEFIRHDKDNLTYKAYWGTDHMFKKMVKDQILSKHKIMTANIWNWLSDS